MIWYWKNTEDCVNIPKKSHLAQKVETSYTKDKAAIDVVSLMEIYLSRSASIFNRFLIISAEDYHESEYRIRSKKIPENK